MWQRRLRDQGWWLWELWRQTYYVTELKNGRKERPHMSSDWKDTNAVWPDTRVPSEGPYDAAPLKDQSGQVLVHPGTDPLQQDADAVEEPPDLSLSKSEATVGVLRQLSPLFAPLLFGAITFLIILPFVQTNRGESWRKTPTVASDFER